jgi:hypothetical protein
MSGYPAVSRTLSERRTQQANFPRQPLALISDAFGRRLIVGTRPVRRRLFAASCVMRCGGRSNSRLSSTLVPRAPPGSPCLGGFGSPMTASHGRHAAPRVQERGVAIRHHRETEYGRTRSGRAGAPRVALEPKGARPCRPDASLSLRGSRRERPISRTSPS